MMRDIHKQITFLERLQKHPILQRRRYNLERCRRDTALRDIDPGFEIVGADVVCESAELFDADVGFGGEIDEDGADLGRRGWVGF